MAENCHIEHTSDSVAASFEINYLLLNMWFRRFVGQFEIPKSASTVECEVLGTPIPENVFIEPHAVSTVGSSWFWMNRVSEASRKEIRFLLSVRENDFARTVYVLRAFSPFYELSSGNYHSPLEKLPVERLLSDRFQAFLMSYLEVDYY